MQNIITTLTPKDIALIAESIAIIIFSVYCLVREITHAVRHYRRKKRKALEDAQLPALIEERRKRDHERFRQISHEIEQMP